MSIEEAEKHTVFPTEQVLKLLKTSPQCKLDYVSTVGVNGQRQEPLKEDRILGPREFFNTYEAGKAAAESLLYRAMDHDQKITIHRPSMVVGDSQNGRIIHHQVFYHIIRLLTGFYTKGFQPDLRNFRLDTIPVDFVAKSIVSSMLHEDSIGRILNICSGEEHSYNLGQMQEMARICFKKYKVPIPKLHQIPLVVFSNALKFMIYLTPISSRKRIIILKQLLSYAKKVQPFKNDQSLKIYESWGLKLPSVDTYLMTCLDEYARQFSLRDKEV
jgi:nucleoside-diphosphate-sugar epimerase